MAEWKDWCNQVSRQYSYPDKVFNLALMHWRNISAGKFGDGDQIKEAVTNFNGYTCQAQFFPSCNDEYEEYGKVFEEKDLKEDFFFLRKFTLNYLLYKKYSKLLSTYIEGMFLQSDKCVIENPDNHVIIREADPDEPGATIRMLPKFQCMEKSSKRLI